MGEWDFEYLAMSKDKNRQIEYETIEKDGAFFDKIDPLNHTDRIVSPLMVLHGVKDPRVSIEESDQIVNKVKQQNHPVTYIRFEDEGHSFINLENKMTAYSAMARFLEKILERVQASKISKLRDMGYQSRFG